jgi:hypothetical protein
MQLTYNLLIDNPTVRVCEEVVPAHTVGVEAMAFLMGALSDAQPDIVAGITFVDGRASQGCQLTIVWSSSRSGGIPGITEYAAGK